MGSVSFVESETKEMFCVERYSVCGGLFMHEGDYSYGQICRNVERVFSASVNAWQSSGYSP